MVYLGLTINTTTLTIKPTHGCIRHLLDLASIVQQETHQVLQRISGYIAWVCYAMGWPLFLANFIRHRYTVFTHFNRSQSHAASLLLCDQGSSIRCYPINGSGSISRSSTSRTPEHCLRGNGSGPQKTSVVLQSMPTTTHNGNSIHGFSKCISFIS
jgi:hypothetical protein